MSLCKKISACATCMNYITLWYGWDPGQNFSATEFELQRMAKNLWKKMKSKIFTSAIQALILKKRKIYWDI